MSAEQFAIMLTGVTAVFLSQSKSERLRQFACLFGIAGQPFWFYAAWSAEQWGIFAMCFLYTFSWARGVWNFWIAPAMIAGTRRRAHAMVAANTRTSEALSASGSNSSDPVGEGDKG